MSQPGVGVMIRYLCGNKDSVDTFLRAEGQKIKQVKLEEDQLRFEMADGFKFALIDLGQSCCESRYMTTDDKLEEFVGAELTGAELKAGPEVEGEYGNHEQEFLEVQTSKGCFTIVNHNEHNGYYGGFAVRAVEGWKGSSEL